MRTVCPASRRSLPSTRLPSTRSSPLRTMRWIWVKESPGNFRLQKAVDPHAGFVRRHRHGLHAGHRHRLRRLGRLAAGRGFGGHTLERGDGPGIHGIGKIAASGLSRAGCTFSGPALRLCAERTATLAGCCATRASARPLAERLASRLAGRFAAILSARPGGLPPAARLPWSTAASHDSIPVRDPIRPSQFSTAPPARRMQERDEDGAITGTVLAI